MQEILNIVLTSMQQDMDGLNHVALNLANVATPGYK
jgi:flagellar basal body rod protein FlgG